MNQNHASIGEELASITAELETTIQLHTNMRAPNWQHRSDLMSRSGFIRLRAYAEMMHESSSQGCMSCTVSKWPQFMADAEKEELKMYKEVMKFHNMIDANDGDEKEEKDQSEVDEMQNEPMEIDE